MVVVVPAMGGGGGTGFFSLCPNLALCGLAGASPWLPPEHPCIAVWQSVQAQGLFQSKLESTVSLGLSVQMCMHWKIGG